MWSETHLQMNAYLALYLLYVLIRKSLSMLPSVMRLELLGKKGLLQGLVTKSKI